MLTSAKRLLRYPQSTDTPDIPRDFTNLVADLESEYGVIATRSILDTGVLNHTRAGRVLTLADFTTLMGLSAPIALWNLGDLTDVSGNARNLSNKGAVPFGKGITAAATEAAVFSGLTGQALYISSTSDAAAELALRIKTGSWGAWMRTPKKSTPQHILTKSNSGATQFAYGIIVNGATNTIQASVTFDGSTLITAVGTTDVTDDRWHHIIATFDGSALRLYVDGVLEASSVATGTISASTGPINIGAYGGDAATATANPHYGRIDEAFVTADVLNEDQVRMLYAVKLAHGAGRTPRAARLGVKRRKRGPVLAAADFTVTPKRLHNLGGGASDNDVSGSGQNFTTNLITANIAGPDGKDAGAGHFNGTSAYAASTDAGLPDLMTSASFGCWFKTASGATQTLMSWGAAAARRTLFHSSSGIGFADGTQAINGGWFADGNWHFAVVIMDNSFGDGLKAKVYVDGKFVVGLLGTFASTTLNGVFSIGRDSGGATSFFSGAIARAFVTNYAMLEDEILNLYAKGSSLIGAGNSPKAPADHIEMMDATNVYFIGDTLDSQNTIDLAVEA